MTLCQKPCTCYALFSVILFKKMPCSQREVTLCQRSGRRRIMHNQGQPLHGHSCKPAETLWPASLEAAQLVVFSGEAQSQTFKPILTVACCSRPCFGTGVGLDDPQRSLPTSNILCDSVINHLCKNLMFKYGSCLSDPAEESGDAQREPGCKVRNKRGGLEPSESMECCSHSSSGTSYSSLDLTSLAGFSLLGCRGGSVLPRAWAAPLRTV